MLLADTFGRSNCAQSTAKLLSTANVLAVWRFQTDAMSFVFRFTGRPTGQITDEDR